MKERPILFSAPMVMALLAGYKTQTRRIVKARKDRELGCELAPCELAGEVNSGDYRNCPYGQPGDRLWVRETWGQGSTRVMYRAGCNTEYRPPDGRWRPSIHMPRWASRITLEIEKVRIERLHSITEADCRAEGCAGGHGSIPNYMYNATPHEHFGWIWQSVGGDWSTNPWVWVPTFRRILP